MMWTSVLLVLIAASVSYGDQIEPHEAVVGGSETDSVTLSCTYETSYDYVDLYWYRQYPNHEPQFILWKGARSRDDEKDIPNPNEYDSSTSTTSTQLIIKKSALKDSALYYCALQTDSVLGYGGAFSATDPLTFGAPISLTVVPKDGPDIRPTLSILSPVEGKGSDICLAAGFFLKDKKMYLNDDSNGLDTSKAALSLASKTYYYAGFNKESITKCKMDKEEATNTPDSPATAEPSVTKSVPLDCPQSASNSSVSTNTGDPKMNSVTLLMTGLRILLAKCVAVNVLMSVKAFIV